MNRPTNGGGVAQRVTSDPFGYAKAGAGQKAGNPMVLGAKKPANQNVFNTPFGATGAQT